MSKLPLLVIGRKFHHEKPVFISQEKSIVVAEGVATNWYLDNSAYEVTIIEVNAQEIVLEEKLNKVFIITRTCKCCNLQWMADFAKGVLKLICPSCNNLYKKEALVTPVETVEEEEEMEILAI